MRAAGLLLLAGCGLPAPGPGDLALVRQLPPIPGPYARVKAVADVEGEKLSGTFDVLLLARTGPRPLVRLQLLPDLGGKALDLSASPDFLQGRFPHSGEEVAWRLPEDAKAHPLLFIAITLLERFAPVTDDRVIGAGQTSTWALLELSPVVEGADVTLVGRPWQFAETFGRHFSWGCCVNWSAREHEVVAPGFHLKLRDVKVEPLDTLDESLLKLK